MVHPPIDTNRFEPTDERSGRFLVVSRLRRHKRIDLAIAAATRFGWPLDVIGDGPDDDVLRSAAGPTVRFHGRLPDDVVRAAMARCIALLVPGSEDFGMTLAEVQAAGRPPVAFARGGALEIVDDGATGFLFDEPTIESLAAAMARAIDTEVDRGALLASARRFDRSVFDAGLAARACRGRRVTSHRRPVAGESARGRREHGRPTGGFRFRDPHRDQPDGRPIQPRRPADPRRRAVVHGPAPAVDLCRDARASSGLWLVSLACRPRRLDPGPRFVWVPVVGLVAVAGAGIPSSIDPTLAAFNVLRLLVMVGIAAYVINEVDGLERLAVPLMLMIGLEAAVAIGQAVLQRSLGLTLAARDQERRRRHRGERHRHRRRLPAGSGRTALLRTRTSSVGSSRSVCCSSPRSSANRAARVWRAWPCSRSGVVTLFLTFSRSAWVGFAVGLVVAVVMLAARGDRVGVRRWAGAALTAVVVSAVLAVPFAAQLAARTTLSGPVRTETRSIDERLALARVTLEVIADHPVLGTGLGTLAAGPP